MEEDTSGNQEAQYPDTINYLRNNAGNDDEVNDFEGMDDWVVMDDLNSGNEDILRESDQGLKGLSERSRTHLTKAKDHQKASWQDTFENTDNGKLHKDKSPNQDEKNPGSFSYQLCERRFDDLLRHGYRKQSENRDDDRLHGKKRDDFRLRHDQKQEIHHKGRRRHKDQNREKRRHDDYYAESSRRQDLNYQRRDVYHRGHRRQDDFTSNHERQDSGYQDHRRHRGSEQIMDRSEYGSSSSYAENSNKRYRSSDYPRDLSPMGDRNRSPIRERSPLYERERSPPYQRELSPPYQREQSPPYQRELSPPYQRERSPLYLREQSPPYQRERSPPYQRERSPFQPELLYPGGRSPIDFVDRTVIYERERSPMRPQDYGSPIDSGNYHPPMDFGDQRSTDPEDYQSPMDYGNNRPSVDFGDQRSMDEGSSEQTQRIGIGGVFFDLSARSDGSQGESPHFSQLSFKEDMFCPICKVDDTRYRTRFDFHNHWLKTHAKYRNFFPCPIQGCLNTFRAKPKMIQHVLQIHSKEQRFEANFEEILLEELSGPKEENSNQVKPAPSTTGSQNKIWENLHAAITNITGGQQVYPGIQQSPNVHSVTNQAMPPYGNPPMATYGNPPLATFGNPPLATFGNPPLVTFANAPTVWTPPEANRQGVLPVSSSGSYLPSPIPNLYSGAYQAVPIVGRNEIQAPVGTNKPLPYKTQTPLQTYDPAMRQSRWDKIPPNIGTVKPLHLQKSRLSASYPSSTVVSSATAAIPPFAKGKPVQLQIKPQIPIVKGNIPPSHEIHNPPSDDGGVLNYNSQSSTSSEVLPNPETLQGSKQVQDLKVSQLTQQLSAGTNKEKVEFEPSMCCPVCKSSMKFAKELEFYEHWNLYHVKTLRKYDCPENGCKAAASSQKNLQEHYRVAHNAGQVEVSRDTGNMLLNVQPELAENPWFRNPKGYVFSPGHANELVFKAHSTCPVCVVSEVFVDLQSFQLHWQNFHSKFQQRFLCSNSDCDVSTASIEKLKQHYLKSHNCGNRTLTLAAVEALDDCHVKMEVNPLYLDPSPYRFKQEKRHNIEFRENMVCPICANETVYKYLTNFQQHWETTHMRYIHDYKCPFGTCRKFYKTFIKLKNHYIEAHNANKKKLSQKTIDMLLKADKNRVSNMDRFVEPANCKFAFDEDDEDDSPSQYVVFTSGMQCPICQKRAFAKEEHFIEHWQGVHFQSHKAFLCIIKGCKESKPTFSSLRSHYSFKHNGMKQPPARIIAQFKKLKQVTVPNPNYINPKNLKYLPAGKELA